MRRALRLIVVLVIVALQAAAAAAQTVQITPLVRDGRVHVSFRLADSFNDSVKQAIHSGTNITFFYEVELRRQAALWLDRTMNSALVAASVRFDNLTRKYQYTLMFNGRTEKVDQTDSYDVVREWLTEFDKLPLFNSASLERNVEYYVRVRAHTTLRNATSVWPWKQHDVMAQVKFTFLPH